MRKFEMGAGALKASLGISLEGVYTNFKIVAQFFDTVLKLKFAIGEEKGWL